MAVNGVAKDDWHVRREACRGGDDHHDVHGYSWKHKRKSFLAELFD
jgi:hypothetical protein